MQRLEPEWIYLDDEVERERLAQAIRAVRQRVRQAAEMRQENAYEPLYEGWSLAALLAHLNANDTLGRWLVQAALVGIRPRFDAGKLHRLNDWQRNFFQRTPIEKTFERIETHGAQLCDFVHRLPLKKLSTPVWLVATQEWSTVERATQIFFVRHWQEHLTQIEGQASAPAPPSSPLPSPPTSTESEA